MAIKKAPGGVEDLTLGMGTEQQERKGSVVTITQINGGRIPYSDTQSINQKIDQTQSHSDAVRIDLDNHKADHNNPHQIQPEDINAAPIDHTHTIGDVNGLQTELNNKSNVGHTHQVDDVDGLQDDLDYLQNQIDTQTHPISDIVGLQTELDNKANVGDSFLKSEHVQESTGAADAGKPVILGSTGELHPSMTGSGSFPVGSFTPTSGNEYPDNTGVAIGGYWTVIGVDDTNGYTFTGGDLAGETAYNGDALINGEQGWAFTHIGFEPNDYYRIDGTVAISAPFAGGGQQLKNIAPATENGDAVEYSQIAGLATDYIRHDGTIAMTAPLDVGTNQIVNLVDGVLDTDAATVSQINAVEADLSSHTSDTNNPHSVTADQVGAEPLLPIGSIIMYSGLLIDIPSNWALCDGTNGTPNLTDKFVRGTNVEADIGSTGGSDDAIVVSHTHTANHSHTASSNDAGSHSHGYIKPVWLNEGTAGTANDADGTTDSTTDSAGNHSHVITVDTANVTTSSSGSSGTDKNIPAYVKLAYIMKISGDGGGGFEDDATVEARGVLTYADALSNLPANGRLPTAAELKAYANTADVDWFWTGDEVNTENAIAWYDEEGVEVSVPKTEVYFVRYYIEESL